MRVTNVINYDQLLNIILQNNIMRRAVQGKD
jgi:small nuclear ribonucleoprotein (snRNP)-like protein